MTIKDINKAKNPLFKLVLPALQRAANNAREQAIIHNTKLILWKNNHIVKLTPNEIKEESPDY